MFSCAESDTVMLHNEYVYCQSKIVSSYFLSLLLILSKTSSFFQFFLKKKRVFIKQLYMHQVIAFFLSFLFEKVVKELRPFKLIDIMCHQTSSVVKNIYGGQVWSMEFSIVYRFLENIFINQNRLVKTLLTYF